VMATYANGSTRDVTSESTIQRYSVPHSGEYVLQVAPDGRIISRPPQSSKAVVCAKRKSIVRCTHSGSIASDGCPLACPTLQTDRAAIVNVEGARVERRYDEVKAS
jgi:hypothetical protein